jgi:hypothetical protein
MRTLIVRNHALLMANIEQSGVVAWLFGGDDVLDNSVRDMRMGRSAAGALPDSGASSNFKQPARARQRDRVSLL